MNIETGEIIKNPTREQVETQNMVKLTKREMELMEDIPEAYKPKVWNHWREYKQVKKFNNIFEKNKAEEAFYLGYNIALSDGGLLDLELEEPIQEHVEP